MVDVNKNTNNAKMLADAYKSGNEEEVAKAWESFSGSILEQCKQDFEEFKQANDEKVLSNRGYRQLTNVEKKFYERLIESAKSSNPKQAFANILTDANGDLMPQTIIDDVYKDLVEEHPLLAKVNFVNTKYLTKWILNDHASQKAVWGKITESITKEITSAFREIEIDQNKLSAYAVISKDMLELGPTFIDAYIRRVLKEALACGLEYGIVNGSGHEEPVGLIRDIHKGVSVNSETGYPKKTAIKVTNFDPATYGSLLSKLTTKENGKKRSFSKVTILCNNTDYLTKIMPATTIMNVNGTYVNNIFPFPTEVVISNEVADGQALLCLLPDYFFGIGGSKDGVIEYSDDFKFLEDMRTYKIKQFATGIAEDNTVSLLLDISALESAVLKVENKEVTEVV